MKQLLVLLVLAPVLVFGQLSNWTETTQEDFADGWYERDIYCSYRISTTEPDSGAIEYVPRFDFDNNGWIDLVVSNKPNEGGAGEAKNDWIMLYRGNDGDYNTQDFLSYATRNGAEADGADLDLDGYADLIVCHYYSPSMAVVGGVCIYWGTASGPSATDTTMLPAVQQTEAVYVADVNKDGWIDIISGDYSQRLDTTRQYSLDSIAIFWGGPNRDYSNSNATYLPARTARHNFQVADFDRDGYYDILVINYFEDKNYIYWGSASGFSESERSDLGYLSGFPHGSTTADFDKDGYLDIVLTGTGGPDRAFIYYGDGSRRYRNAVELATGSCFGGCGAIDWNSDSWLDIIFYRGNASVDSLNAFHEKPYIYLGSAEGFSDSSRLEIGARQYNLSGGFLTDLNRDGAPDLFVHSWDLFDSSGVAWGPDFNQHTQLYCNKDHHALCRDMGHVYDRETRDPYISNVYDAGQVVNWDAVISTDSTPGASNVIMYARTGSSDDPADGNWTDWVPVRANGAVPDIDAAGDTVINRYFQYRADMDWNYAAELPVLYEVTTYWPAGISIEPDQEDTTYPDVEIRYNLTITNDGSISDLINVVSQGTRSDWQISLLDVTGQPLVDNNSDGSVDVDSVSGAGGMVNLTVSLTPPDDALVGDVDTTVVWVYSTNNETVSDSAYLITHVAPLPAIIIYPDQSNSAYRGETVRYQLSVENNGNGPDVVDVSAVSDLDWTFTLMDETGTPIVDTDGDEIEDLESIPAAQAPVTLLVDVLIPPDANENDIDTTWVTAHSSVDPATTARAYLATTALVPPDTVPVVALRIEPDTLLETYPETPIIFPMRIQNMGNRYDTLDIEVTFRGDEWGYRLLAQSGNELGDANDNDIPDVGVLAPGASTTFQFEVTPPQGVGNNFTGITLATSRTIGLLTARSSVRSTVTDLAEDTVVVIPQFNVHNFPNPFEGPTTFYFSLPEDGNVTLKIYNRAGEYLATVIEDQSYVTGVHFESWDGLTSQGEVVAPGVLLYSFEFVPENQEHKPIKVVKKALSQGGGS